jgi:hypothetical protein
MHSGLDQILTITIPYKQNRNLTENVRMLPCKVNIYPPWKRGAQHGRLTHGHRTLYLKEPCQYRITSCPSLKAPAYAIYLSCNVSLGEEIWFDLVERFSQTLLIFQLALLLGKSSFLVVSFKGTSIPGMFNLFLEDIIYTMTRQGSYKT